MAFSCNISILYAQPLKVAVIDTGFNFKYSDQVPLCNGSHRDFTGEGFHDFHGHGTNIAGLIVNSANSNNYCLVIIKAYSFKPNHKNYGTSYVTEALTYAYEIKANIINLSGGGLKPIKKEQQIVKKILDSNIALITAAGNNGANLDKNCTFYPACYDSRIYVIGSKNPKTNHDYSNYGKIVDMTFDGGYKTVFNYTFRGTSQSSAIFTGTLLKTIDNLQKK